MQQARHERLATAGTAADHLGRLEHGLGRHCRRGHAAGTRCRAHRARRAAVSGVVPRRGLVLGAGLALVVVGVTRRWRAAVLAAAAAALVALGFTAAGFWWFTGYHDLQIIYAASAAKTRPYSYFVWANLAAFGCATGPAVGAGLRRLVTTPRAVPPAAALLTAVVLAAVVVADLSGLSKAEVERIWLPFGIWLITACAVLPRRHHCWWLAAQAALALGINSLLFTVW